MFGSRPSGDSQRVVREWELYQAVVPGQPAGSCRSCLIGERELVEVDEDGTTMGVVDRSRVRVLEQMS